MSVNSNGYIHLGGTIRNIYILILLSVCFPLECSDATLNNGIGRCIATDCTGPGGTPEPFMMYDSNSEIYYLELYNSMSFPYQCTEVTYHEGGDSPYVDNGIPAIPAIMNFVTPYTNQQQNGLEVQITTKSNK